MSFAYDPAHVILKDVSFDIAPGQVAAFVGPTGGGKSTIINLVARFYDPVSGAVSIDGTDIRGYTMKSVRDQISFVLQETLLFHAPIWQNIAYGRPEATRAEIIQAAELANADEFIRQMPEGYDTTGGRARSHPVWRTAPTGGDRARHHPGYADPGDGRTDVRIGRAVRAGGIRGTRPADEGKDLDRYCPSPGNDSAS